MPQNPTTPAGSPDRFRSTHPDSPRNASSFEDRPPVIRARYTDEAPVARRAVPTAPSRQADVTDFVPTPAGSPRKRSRGRTIGKVAIVGFAGALVATMALPAYAFSPGTESDGLFAASQADRLRQGDAQSVAVAGGVVQAAIARDGFTAEAAPPPPPPPEPEPVVEPVVDTTDVAEARAETAESFTSYEGASASELAASAPSTSYSLSAVFNTALQYQGVPYVFGGADPSGFDCSGLVMYVFAQYGISMPHSAAGQAAMGTQIPLSEAQPGDLVIMPGHDGFYAGNGNILHAPYEGASVRVQPIWTSNYTIVRISG